MSLDRQLDQERIADRLQAAGLSAHAAMDAVRVAARLVAQLAPFAQETDALHLFRVPGRVEVLGKHTDYAGGSSLLAAAEQAVLVAAVPRQDRRVRVHALDVAAQTEFDLIPSLEPSIGGWQNYPMTVARRLARNFPGLTQGAEIALSSTIPLAAGMSSSSALMIGVYLALAAINELDQTPAYGQNIGSQEALAEYLGTIENGQTYGTLAGDRGVGTFGGSEDHTAILCCQAGHLSKYRYCPTAHEATLPWPADHIFVIAASGVVADKTGNARHAYNRAAALAAEVAAVWNGATGRRDAHMAAMLAATGCDPAPILAVLAQNTSQRFAPADLRQRFLHFHVENAILIPEASAALAAGDVAAFAAAANRSQAEGARLLGNQIVETEALAALALQCGAGAASAFGAGFGGSVWALVPTADADAFLTDWAQRYTARFPEHAQSARFLQTCPGPAAGAL